MINGKEILITGGSGSLGKVLVKLLQNNYTPRGIRIYSRDELKQWEFKNELAGLGLDKNVAFLLGDVSNYDRLHRALDGVDTVINCAAMKQVPACETNPSEALRTNIQGAENMVQACIERQVKNAIHISTDKAVYPVNLYGATKAVAERLFIAGNIYNKTRFSCCRYGNVLGSRGSIVPLFRKQAESGSITITDKRMTRFWITIKDVSQFIINRVQEMQGGEIFVPRMPSMKIMDMANIIAPGCKIEETGIRPGEKLHECLVTYEESRHMERDAGKYIIYQPHVYDSPKADRWAYYSDTNDLWLSPEGLKSMLGEV